MWNLPRTGLTMRLANLTTRNRSGGLNPSMASPVSSFRLRLREFASLVSHLSDLGPSHAVIAACHQCEASRSRGALELRPEIHLTDSKDRSTSPSGRVISAYYSRASSIVQPHRSRQSTFSIFSISQITHGTWPCQNCTGEQSGKAPLLRVGFVDFP